MADLAPSPDIIAQTADGVQHVFPAGTPGDVIDKAISTYTQQQAPGYQQAKQQFMQDETQGGARTPERAGAALNYLNGTALFGFAPQALGGLNAAQTAVKNVVGLGDGPTIGESYRGTRDAAQELVDDYRAKNPYTAFGLNMAGGIGVGGATGDAIKAVPGVLKKVGATVGLGAGEGALYGAGNNPDDPAAGAETGAIVGGITGAAVPAAANIARKAVGAITPAIRSLATGGASAAGDNEARVQQYLSQQLGDRPVAAITDSPSVQRGAPFTVAEALGRNAMGDLSAMTRRPGVAGDLATDVLSERQFGDGSPIAGTNARVLDSVSDATGVAPGAAQADQEFLLKGGRSTVNPAYSGIRAQDGPVMTPELQQLVDQDPHAARALATVKANTRNAPDVPDASTWLRVKQQLSDDVQRDPRTGKPLNVDFNDQVTNAASDLTSALKTAIPGFSDAQAGAAVYMAPQDAYDRATGLLFGNSKGKTVSDTQKLADSLKSSAELAAAQRAFATDIMNRVNAGRGSVAALTTPAAQQKLSIMFGPEAAQKIAASALDEKSMSAFFGRAAPGAGSITSEVMNRGAAQDASLGGEVASHALAGAFHGGIHGAVKGAATPLLQRGIATLKTPGMNQDFRDVASQYLLRPASEFGQIYKPPVASTRSISTPTGIGVTAGATSSLAGQNQ